MALRPYEQGHLDYYCGIYSIANALKLIDKKMRGEEPIKLFIKILGFLEKAGKLGSVAKKGVHPDELKLILEQVISNRYCITISRPFYRKRKQSIDQILNKIATFLEEGSSRAVIVGVLGDFDHWSVIKRVTKKEIHFFDSDSLKKLPRNKCTTKSLTARRPHLITPAEIFFLQRDNTKKRGRRRKHVPAKDKR
jgi:hypothetical protein